MIVAWSPWRLRQLSDVFGLRSMTDFHTKSSLEPVHLRVDALPSDVAAQIREVQDQDPELLRRILLYGMTHRVVFETLSRSWNS